MRDTIRLFPNRHSQHPKTFFVMDSALQAYQQDQRRYERLVGEIIKQWPRGGVYVDGGAHAGLHTQPMLERQDVRRVYAAEAVPHLCDRLARVLVPSSKLRMIKGAIGAEAGIASFAMAADALGYSGLKQRTIQAVQQWERIDVQVYTLDAAIESADHADVSFVKLDIEGGEFDALRGAREVMVAGRPLVVFENGLRNSAASYGYGWEEFHALFDSLDYEVQDFFGRAVDHTYWNRTLSTYMFVALPRTELDRGWVASELPRLVDQVAASPGA